MKLLFFIFPFILSSCLFAEDISRLLIRDNPAEISLIDTSELDPKLKLFLDKFYQKNFSSPESIKAIKSMQFVGTYTLNREKIGTIKIIKKRPNKYKSLIKHNDGTKQIIIFDGLALKSGQTTNSDPLVQWQSLDTLAPENLWIHYEQLFDSTMLNPKDPNKKISLGIPFMEDGQVIQPISIELKNKIKITNFIPIRDNLIKRTFLEFNEPENPRHISYTINFEDYDLINDIMIPKKITTQLNEDTIMVTEYSDIQFNLGISDFFFRAISF